MAIDIKVPPVGESITEGTLVRWLKKDGDIVSVDEPIFELETEKATSEVPSPAAGRLAITTREGQTVTIGSVVGQIDPAVAATARAPQAQPGTSEPAGSGQSRGKIDVSAPAAQSKAPSAEPGSAPSPAARKIAADEGLDLSTVSGTGRGGRITKGDVLEQIERQGPGAGDKQRSADEPNSAMPNFAALVTLPSAVSNRTPGPSSGGREHRERMSPIRQRIAERLLSSQRSTATLTTFNEADMTAVMALRSQYKDRFKEKYQIGLGFMPFFVKACVEALRAYPIVNARIDEAEIVYQDYYHLGIAVSTEKGLVVPVLRDADQLSFAEIERRIAQLAQKVRDGKFAVSDLQGGTFTITNGGVFGSLVSTPILNPPQSAILGMHAIQKRPIAVNDQVVIRPMMYLALSYDHRLIDGRDAVLFLVRIKECLENPERLLLEV